jgi:hypothetical protein
MLGAYYEIVKRETFTTYRRTLYQSITPESTVLGEWDKKAQRDSPSLSGEENRRRMKRIIPVSTAGKTTRGGLNKENKARRDPSRGSLLLPQLK